MKIKSLFILLILLAAGGSLFGQAPNNARMLSTPNAQTGTTYTFTSADTTRVTTFSNAAPIAASLPNGAAAGFGPGNMLSVVNVGAGTLTITCVTCTISTNGVASATLVLASGGGADIYGGIGNPAVNYVALPSPSGVAPGSFTTLTVSGTATLPNIDQILLVDGVKYTTIDAAVAAVPSFVIAASPTGCTQTANTVTCTTSLAHGLSVNQTVFVNGVLVNGYNGEFPLSAVTTFTFSYLNCVVSQSGGQGCITGLAGSGSGTVAPVAHIIIPPNYFGAEVSTCTNLDNAGNAMGGYFSNTPANIHVEDRRGTSKCAYNIGWNGNQLQSNPNNLSIWRRDTSPSITSSNLVTDLQVTGIIPGGQALAGGTFEVDTIGNITTPSGVPFIQATNGQWAVRSLGGTITQIMGGSGGGGIDRTYATSNIVQASGLFAFDPKNISVAGATILESYGLIASSPTSGTRNNYAIFSQGHQVFSDNFGIDVMNGAYALPAGATGQRLLRFGGDNSQATAGVSQYSTTNFAGVPYHFIYTPGTASNWMIGSQLNTANAFEITPSTAAGGTTFSTPGLRVFNNGSGGASTVAIDSGGLQPRVAGAGALGTTLLPFANVCLGTAATNNICTSVSATAAARTMTYPDPLGNVTAPYVIASGTTTLTSNAALAAVTSQAANTTAAVGTLTTDSIEWSFATAPTAGDNLCHVLTYVTAGNVNFVRTNPTAAAQNVSALVINWRVIR